MAFDRNRRGGFGSGKGSFGGRDRKMFKITCSNCGKEAQVPFEPRGDKPVYCSDCFEKMHPRNNDRGARDDRGGRDGRDRGGNDMASQLNGINSKLDKILGLLMQNNNPVQAPITKTAEVKEESPEIPTPEPEPETETEMPEVEEKPKKTVKKASKKKK